MIIINTTGEIRKEKTKNRADGGGGDAVNLDSFPTALHELDGRLLLPPVFRMFQHPLRRAKGRESPEEIAPHLIQKRKKIVWNSNGKGEKTKGRKKKKQDEIKMAWKPN
jgi:hypothetical protein